MEISAFIQLASSFTGLLAAIFFAHGVVTQNIDMMLDMSQAYLGPNPSTIKSLSQQKADYSFGIIGLLITFSLQAISFIAPQNYVALINAKSATMLFAVVFVCLFLLLRFASKAVSERFEIQIKERFKQQEVELLSNASEQLPKTSPVNP